MNRILNVSDLRCLIDIHLHLDGSLSLDTVRQLAEIQNIDIPASDDELIDRLQVPSDCTNLNDYLKCFDFPLELMQTAEALELCIYNLMCELKEQNLIYCEIRFAPQLHTRKGLSQMEVVDAVVTGLDKFNSEMKASSCNDSVVDSFRPLKSGIILCCMRGNDNQDANLETVRIAKHFIGKGVVALDLAGAEALFATDKFENIFELARHERVPFTIHAGEADGATSIRCAINYGASRIGHGVRCLEDENLCDELALKNIALEMCPTSNLNTRVISSIGEYPLPQILKKGIKVTINTDNMTVSGTCVAEELQMIKDTFMLSNKDVKKLLKNAVEAAFTNNETKEYLMACIEFDFEKIILKNKY